MFSTVHPFLTSFARLVAHRSRRVGTRVWIVSNARRRRKKTTPRQICPFERILGHPFTVEVVHMLTMRRAAAVLVSAGVVLTVTVQFPTESAQVPAADTNANIWLDDPKSIQH